MVCEQMIIIHQRSQHKYIKGKWI